MFLDTIKCRGMPLRGSIQDRIACEMLLRDRRQRVSTHAYLGRILAATVQLPEAQYKFLTEMLSFEVFHENYNPQLFETKQRILKDLREAPKQQEQDQQNMLHTLKSLDLSEEDLRPVTPVELEQYKRKIRKRKLELATEDKE